MIALPAAARRSAFARDVAAGLAASPKRLSCCYFYDAEGSRLFEEICALPEYYLTRTERAILNAHAADVAGSFREPATLVELGSGNASKTRLIIEAFLKRHHSVPVPVPVPENRSSETGTGTGTGTGTLLRYVPVDICRTVLEESAIDLLHSFARLEILAVAAEYQEALRHLQSEVRGPKLVLSLGSNIGNFDRHEAAAFLGEVRATLAAHDRVLVGIDLRKDRAVLEPAYDDPQGVTAEFNKNILNRINRELGGRFDLARFRHQAVYDDVEGRIEMYLVSACDQQAAIDELKQVFVFAAGERIHTEDSYKYSPAEIEALARQAGLTVEQQWFDAGRLFSVNLLMPANG